LGSNKPFASTSKKEQPSHPCVSAAMKCGQCLLLGACLALAEGAQLRTDQKKPSTEELQKILKPFGFGKISDLHLLMRGVDENKDGKADYTEFKALMSKLAFDTKTKWLDTEDEKQRMFNDVDADHDKEVTFDELTKFNIADAGYPEGYNARTGMKIKPKTNLPPPAPILPAGFSAVTGGVMPAGLKCVAWRRTTTCMPSGPRDPLQDKDCLSIATSQESGFCECEGMVHTAAVPCGHEPIDCTKECASMQKLNHEKFGGGDGDGGDGCPDCAMDKVKKSGNPYHQALRYGQKAMTDVNAAVDNSNKLLGSARNMISKMMSTKPWAEVTKLGKEAEEAGKKTEMLAKLARPYIYAQVNKTIN